MKKHDWKARRIKYNTFHLNLPLQAAVVFLLTLTYSSEVSTFSNPLSSAGRDTYQVGIKYRI